MFQLINNCGMFSNKGIHVPLYRSNSAAYLLLITLKIDVISRKISKLGMNEAKNTNIRHLKKKIEMNIQKKISYKHLVE